MKKVFLYMLMVALMLGAMACTQSATGQTIVSDEQRVTSPNVSESDTAMLSDGNNAFALDLYQTLREEDGNFFYSPYSISLALAMTYAGARGETEKQMADTLHFTLPQDQLHQTFNGLDLELSQRGQGAEGKDDKGFRLNIVNAIWDKKVIRFSVHFSIFWPGIMVLG